MALAAQTRDRKKFGESEISVQLGTGSTLYVTNFPPGADEAYIRGLFTKVNFETRICKATADVASSARL